MWHQGLPFVPCNTSTEDLLLDIDLHDVRWLANLARTLGCVADLSVAFYAPLPFFFASARMASKCMMFFDSNEKQSMRQVRS